MPFKIIKFSIFFIFNVFFTIGCGTSTDKDNTLENAKQIEEINKLEKGEFTRDNTLDIVIDTKNSLMWQDTNDTLFIKKSYSDTSGDTAVNYCKNLSLGRYSDWRLPEKNEFQSIMEKDQYPHINKIFKFKDSVIAGGYWTSTIDYEGCYTINNIWITDFLYTYQDKNKTKLSGSCTVETNKHRIRCVRKN